MANCIFCKIVKGEAHSWKVHETANAYAFLDIHPVNRYHTLVIPKQHYVNVFDTPEEELADVMRTLKQVVDLYERKLGMENLQIVSSSGAVAQQDVFHLHFHIVPRYENDGQNIRWKTHDEMVAEYADMLKKLND